jgi:hypothetical protein
MHHLFRRAVVIIGAVTALGTSVQSTFSTVAAALPSVGESSRSRSFQIGAPNLRGGVPWLGREE